MRGIPRWSQDLERSFKEVLYRFLEEVQSTKAAFYLLSEEGSYLLATQYGFGRRDLLAREHLSQDPIVVKARELKVKPLAVNDAHDMPELASQLEGAGTSRMLLLPLYGGSRLLGFVDARDKGRQRLFEEQDLARAAAIGGALLQIVARAHLYEGLDEPEEAPSVEPKEALPAASRLSFGLGPSPSGPPVSSPLDRTAWAHLHDVAQGIGFHQGVVTVALSLIEAGSASMVVYATSENVVDEGALVHHQIEVARGIAADIPEPRLWTSDLRRLSGVSVAHGTRFVASAVLVAEPGYIVTASVVAAQGTSAASRSVARLQRVADRARETTALRHSRRNLARRLLQPGNRRYPELEAHSIAVSRLCWAMTQRLGWDDQSLEDAALAGLLHDIGMRELDYDRLYRLTSPGPDERRLYQQHSQIGAQVLAGIGLDRVANAVRHHHERWDGNGYPDCLAREDIPFLARIVHVAEVYDVLTSKTSYRLSIDHERAMAILSSAGGRQFDPEAVELLAQVV
jgi:putative nucleotidyltransferase with HDIG domain